MTKMRLLWVVLALTSLSSVVPASAIVIEEVDLGLGRTEENQILAPLFEADGVGAISVGDVESRLNPDDFVVYRMTKSVLTDRPQHKTPRYKLAPSIDLGSLLSTAIRDEAEAMGFRVVPEAGDWRVTGTLHDLDVQLRTSGGGFGPTLFYGYADLELKVAHGSEDPVSRRYQTYTFIHLYNAGFGAQDEAKEALMQLVVASAQEAVSRLNRELFHAPRAPGAASRLQGIRPNGEDQEREFLLAGLGGTEEDVPLLLQLLDAEEDEGDRVNILNALAIIGSETAFGPLSRRYAGEDEDCRLFILKAMAYLDTEESRAFISKHGPRDDDLACRVWAKRALSGA